MKNIHIRDIHLLVRVLALATALILLLSQPAGVLNVLADESTQPSGSEIQNMDNNPASQAPESGISSADSDLEENEEANSASSEEDKEANSASSEEDEKANSASSEEDGTSSKEDEEVNSASSEKDEEPTPANPEEDEETKPEGNERESGDTEASDSFAQFVDSAELTYTDGIELPRSMSMTPDNQVQLRLNLDIDDEALATIRENGDARYDVHIPEGLVAVTGEYELKARGKRLGTLYVDDSGTYFAFNTTDEEDAFNEEDAEASSRLRLDILCGLDADCAVNDELSIDLSEYESGGLYVLQLIQPVGFAPVLIEGPLTDDFMPFIENVKLSLGSDPKSPELPSPYLMPDPPPEFYLIFSLKELMGKNTTEGTAGDLKKIYDNDHKPGCEHVQYKIPIPENLKFEPAPDEMELKVNLGDTLGMSLFGTVHIINEKEAYFVFNSDNMDLFGDDVARIKNLNFSVGCVFDDTVDLDNGKGTTVDMDVYDSDKDYNIVFEKNIPEEPLMFKSGEENDGRYEWKVKITSSNDTTKLDDKSYMTGPFTDVMSTNHALDGEVKVTGRLITIPDEEPVDAAAVDYTAATDIATADIDNKELPLVITKDGNGKINGFTFDLPDGYAFLGNIEVAYETVITGNAFLEGAGKSDDTLKNKAEYTWGESKTLSADADLSNINTALVQKEGKFIPAERAIEWTVTVDTLGQSFSELVLHDQMVTYEHDVTSVTVNTHDVDPDPATKGDTSDDGKPACEMELPLIGAGSTVAEANVYTVTYKTYIGDEAAYILKEDFDIENKAWLTYKWDGGPGYGSGDSDKYHVPPTVAKDTPSAVSTPVQKRFVSYNPSTRIATWQITVNPNQLDLSEVRITDTVETAKHKKPKYIGVTNGVNVTEIVEADSTLTFKIPTLGRTSAVITVTTEVVDEDFLGSNQPKVFTNTVELDAVATLSGGGTKNITDQEATATAKLTNNVLKKTAGAYDYDKHTVEWTITVNSDKIDNFDEVVLTDTISEEQELFNSTTGEVVKVTAANQDVKACFTSNPAITSAVANIVGGKIEVTITLGSLDGTTAEVKYTTRYTDPDLISSERIEFTNTVGLESEYTSKPTVTATKVVDDLIVLQKTSVSAEKADDFTALVKYEVWIDQSRQNNGSFTLTDTIGLPAGITDASQIDVALEKSNVGLYKAKIDSATGAFSKKDGEATTTENIKITFNDITRTLTVTFPAPAEPEGGTFSGGEPESFGYILTYEIVMRRTDGKKLTGKMGNSIESTHTGGTVSTTETVDFGTAGEADEGDLDRYIKVQITKKDEKTQQPIEGVEFGLYYKNPEGQPLDYRLIATDNTSSAGTITFSLLMPSYVQEDDYFIKEHPTNGYTGKITLADPIDGYSSEYAADEFLHVKAVVLSSDHKHYDFVMTNKRSTHTVTFYKVAEQGVDWEYKPLGGAAFLLEDLDGNYGSGETVPQPQPDGSGKFTITDLKWGKYKLTETTYPDGYVRHTSTYTLEVKRPTALNTTTADNIYDSIAPVVTLTADDSANAPAQGITEYDGQHAIVNEKGSVSLVKIDPLDSHKPIHSDGTTLKNAKFVIQKQVGSDYEAYETLTKIADGEYYANTATAGTTTDLNGTKAETHNHGTLTIRGLDYGATYRITEVDAPTGFELDASPWNTEVTIGNTRDTIDFTSTNTPALKVENTRKNIYSFSFKKHKETYDTSSETSTGHEATNEAAFGLYHIGAGGALGAEVASAGVTIAAGVVTFTNVAFNDYYIVEETAPSGYVLPVEPTMKVELKRSVESAGPDTVKVKITDIRTTPHAVIHDNSTTPITDNPFINTKGTYTITKTDNLFTGTEAAKLAGAVFTAEAVGQQTRTATTNDEGVATFYGLTTGKTYTITETTAPTGYAASGSTWTFTPSDIDRQGSMTDGTGTIVNNRAAANEFIFTKYGETTAAADKLGGAEFTLRFNGGQPDGGQALPAPWSKDASNQYVQTATSSTTGNIGEVKFTNLPYGSYIITETSAPEGYRLTGTNMEVHFTIAPDGVIDVTSPIDWNGKVTNQMGEFTVTKIDAVDNSKMAGVRFKLTDTTGQAAEATGTTDENGEITFTSLYLEREYTLTEDETPTGYKAPAATSAITFTLQDNATAATGYAQSATYENARDPKYSFGFLKRDDHGKTLDGAVFKLYTDASCTEAVTGFDEDGAPVTTTTITDANVYTATSVNGEVWFRNLAFSTYYVKEYSATEVQTGVQAVTDGDPRDRYAVNTDVLMVELERDGKYTITNTITNDTSTVSTSGGISGLVVTNELLGSITVTKKDDPDESNDVMPNIGFTVYTSDGTTEVHAQEITDIDGKVTFYGIPIGGGEGTQYLIRETQYDTAAYMPLSFNVTLKYDDTPQLAEYHYEITVNNERKGTNSFSIYKKDPKGTAVEGARFTIHREGTHLPLPPATIASDVNGKVTFEHLKPGIYLVQEYAAPAGYIKGHTALRVNISTDTPAVITIKTLDADGTEIDDITSAPNITNIFSTDYSFGFEKQDNKGNKLNGAVFGIYTDSGCNTALTGFDDSGRAVTTGAPITATSGVTASGSADGQVWFTGLAFGEYYVKELSPPTGGPNSYNKSDAVLAVSIKKDGTYTITSADSSVTGTSAVVPKGALSDIIVKNELLGSITLTKTDKWANPVTLPDIWFTLTGANVNESKQTDANGVIRFDNLPFGDYLLTENPVPAGYTVATQAVTVGYTTLAEAAHHVVTEVKNQRAKDYSIDFLKQDQFGNGLNGATFQIVQVKDGTNYSASVFTNPDFSATAVSGKAGTDDGVVTFTDLSFGRYFIRETLIADANYSVSDTVLQADIDAAGNITFFEKVSGANTGTDNGKLVVINNRAGIYSVSFKKTNRSTGAPLAGAVFSVTPVQSATSGVTVTLPAGTPNTAASDGAGTVTFTKLPFGTYEIKEVSAPANYTKCAGSFEVDIDDTGKAAFTVFGEADPAKYDSGITWDSVSGTVIVANVYNPPPAPPPSTGSGSGGSSGNRNPYNPASSTPTTPVNPTTAGLPPFFPPDTTVTPPVPVESTDDYDIDRQTIKTPDGDDYDSVTVTVKSPGGIVVGEIPPPPAKEGYEFDGWYLDPEMKKPYRPGDPLPKGVTRLYAKWLGVSAWGDDYNNRNPGTGDRAPQPEAVAIIAVLAFAAAVISRPRLRSSK